MSNRSAAARILTLLGVAAVLGLFGCGSGDVGSGGTGAGWPGVAVGTVNGFGSVIVDGVRFDDRDVVPVSEVGPGQDVPTEVRLGDRVEVDFTPTGAASGLRVESALVGPVASVTSAGHFVVLGQAVFVNDNPAAGPVTQLGGGYVSASDVAAGDAVEVHGLLVAQGSSGWAIQATRIERAGSLPPFLKVTGVVDQLGGGTFKLGALTVNASSATVLPAGRSLANGQIVAILGQASSLNTVNASSPTLVASQVRIRRLPTDAGQNVLSGAIGSLDVAAKTFVIGAIKVDYSAAAVTPSNAMLFNGLYVRVSGVARTDGTLAAEVVVVRDGTSEAEAELKGTITGFNAATQTLTIRDVIVDVSHAKLSGCPAGGLTDGLFAEVEGSLNSTMVIAQELHCESDPVDGVVEREGKAGTVDAIAKTFVLTSEGGRLQVVRWTADTFFRTVTADTLDGKMLGVEGTLSNGVLVASKVKLAD